MSCIHDATTPELLTEILKRFPRFEHNLHVTTGLVREPCTERPVIEETREELLREDHCKQTLTEVRAALMTPEGYHVVLWAARCRDLHDRYVKLAPAVAQLSELYTELTK